ncbi:MAG: hypothetical protein ACI9S6_001457 [Reinekea sp.]|jgi:hypothetical protein
MGKSDRIGHIARNIVSMHCDINRVSEKKLKECELVPFVYVSSLYVGSNDRTSLGVSERAW